MCKIYKVKFCLLDDIYKYTGQADVADTIVSRHRNFLYSAQHSHNVVVKNLATTCHVVVYIAYYCSVFVFCTYLYPVYIYRVFSVNKGFQYWHTQSRTNFTAGINKFVFSCQCNIIFRKNGRRNANCHHCTLENIEKSCLSNNCLKHSQLKTVT